MKEFSFHFLSFHTEVKLQGQRQDSTFGAAGDYLARRHFSRANFEVKDLTSSLLADGLSTYYVCFFSTESKKINMNKHLSKVLQHLFLRFPFQFGNECYFPLADFPEGYSARLFTDVMSNKQWAWAALITNTNRPPSGVYQQSY